MSIYTSFDPKIIQILPDGNVLIIVGTKDLPLGTNLTTHDKLKYKLQPRST